MCVFMPAHITRWRVAFSSAHTGVGDTRAAARYRVAMHAALALLLRLFTAVVDFDGAPAPIEPAAPASPATPTARADDDDPPRAAAPAAAPSVAPLASSRPDVDGDQRAGPRRVTRSLATTAWPIEPSAAAGFVLAGDALVPWAGATAFAPLFFSAGPVVASRVLGQSTGSLDVIEAVVGAGVGWQGHLGEARARASVVPGVLVSAARPPSGAVVAPGGSVGLPGGNGPLLSAAVIVPLELGLPLGGGVSFTGFVEPSIATAVAYPDDNGVIGYARNRLFVFVGVGLDVGGPLD